MDKGCGEWRSYWKQGRAGWGGGGSEEGEPGQGVRKGRPGWVECLGRRGWYGQSLEQVGKWGRGAVGRAGGHCADRPFPVRWGSLGLTWFYNNCASRGDVMVTSSQILAEWCFVFFVFFHTQFSFGVLRVWCEVGSGLTFSPKRLAAGHSPASILARAVCLCSAVFVFQLVLGEPGLRLWSACGLLFLLHTPSQGPVGGPGPSCCVV